MRVDTLLAHIDAGQRAFIANKVTRYVQNVIEADTRMICYTTRPEGKPKYVRLTDFAMWADKPVSAKERNVKK